MNPRTRKHTGIPAALSVLAIVMPLLFSTTAHALERIDAIELESDELAPQPAVIDAAGAYAYFGMNNNPARVVKVDLESFERVGAIELGIGEEQAISAVIDPAGAYAYFGTLNVNTPPGRVVKVDLEAFERVGAITLETGENELYSAVIDPTGTYAYFGTRTSPGRVVKIDLTTLERVGALELAPGEDFLMSAVIDPAGEYAYFGTGTPAARVVKIDLENFERVGTIELEASEWDLRTAVVDPVGAYAYFGTFTEPGRVVKIDLATFERVASLELAVGEDLLGSAVIDTVGSYAYFGTVTEPGRIVKISLETFERVQVIDMEGGEDQLFSAAIDLAGAFAYFGTYTVPGRVVKVGLIPEGRKLAVTPAAIDFGDIEVGANGGPVHVTVHSTGAETVTVMEIATPAAPFAPAGGSCGETPFLLLPGESCTLSYLFSPDSVGPVDATVTISSDADGGERIVTLQGTGLPSRPRIAVAPESFAVALEQGQTTSETLVIGNLGTGPLEWTLVASGLPGTGTGFMRGDEFVECETELGIMRHDDGTIENGYGEVPDPAATSLAIVDRFTPSVYPASLRSLCLSFLSHPGAPTSLDFEIVIFAAGEGGIPGTELASLPATAHDIPVMPFPVPPDLSPVWYRYDISGLDVSIESGSVYIGARWTPSMAPAVLIAADESAPLTAGYAGGWFLVNVVGFWIPIEDFNSNYRALFMRAVADPRGCLDPDAVPWLGITPDSGSTPAGGSSEVQVTVDAAGLDPGVYHASVCIENNDPFNSMFAVPVELTVTGSSVTPELGFEPKGLDFGAVEIGSPSPPRTATLYNSGDGAATDLVFQLSASVFTIESETCGGTLAAGSECEVVVTFTPDAAGPFDATMEVDSGEGVSAGLELSGSGLEAVDDVFSDRFESKGEP